MSTFSGDIGGEEEDGAGWGGLAPSKAELRAEAKQAALERDAARYRFLRDKADPDAGEPYATIHSVNSWGKWFNTIEQGERLDAAIDAAMKGAL